MSSSRMPIVVRRLRDVLAAQGRSELSDERLLQAFALHRDDGAFAALVRRHGPMVFQVCRRVLGHHQDAEDAFQATFLVLARKVAALRDRTALAGFLHGTAYRIALKAKQSAARGGKHEGRAAVSPSVHPADELSWREVRLLLDEEIARLPEKYQTAFILCCVENRSQAEAARRLGLNERTLSSRLAAARQWLSRRLARRGVELTAVLAATAIATPSASAVSRTLLTQTTQAALAMVADGGSDGGAAVVSPAVAALVKHDFSLRSLSAIKLIAALLVATSLVAGGLLIHRAVAAKETNAKVLPCDRTFPGGSLTK